MKTYGKWRDRTLYLFLALHIRWASK